MHVSKQLQQRTEYTKAHLFLAPPHIPCPTPNLSLQVNKEHLAYEVISQALLDNKDPLTSASTGPCKHLAVFNTFDSYQSQRYSTHKIAPQTVTLLPNNHLFQLVGLKLCTIALSTKNFSGIVTQYIGMGEKVCSSCQGMEVQTDRGAGGV